MRHGRISHFCLVLLIGVLTACAPAVQHGPWVYSGVSGGFRVTGATVKEHDSEYPGLSIAIDGAIRGGHVPADSSKPAFAAGLQTSLFSLLLASSLDDPIDALALLAADVYVAIPASDKIATSIGATASVWHAMPYVQIGSKSPANGGWYVTNAFLFMDPITCCDVGFGRFFWFPSYTRVLADSRRRATHLSVGFGLGRSGNSTVYAITAGVGMEYFRSAARVR